MKSKKYLFVAVIGYLLLVTVLTVVLGIFRDKQEFFFNLATAIILSWIVSLILYYIWAIYFYNINMGWDDEDWEKLHEKKDRDGDGIPDDEPTENPHAGETLGLPPGTVRGTIALSLLVTGLAMVIASFQMTQTFDSNKLYVDNFEFFKTAFLMMIAFYFGNKSLEAISNRNQGVYRPNQNGQGENSQDSGSSGFSSSQSVNASMNPSSTPSIPNNIAPGQASQLKKTLQTETSETEDADTKTDFEDKESVG